MKRKIHYLLNENKTVIKFIYGLIILNVIALILESYQSINGVYGSFFQLFEILSVVIFTIEYLLRLWVCDFDVDNNNDSLGKRLNFFTSPLGIIDLLAILPFYLPMLLPIDLRIMRILRLFRLLRIFKLGRFSKSLKVIGQVLKETKADLIITIFVAFVLLILSSTLMYYFESEAQPEKFASIGHSFWWAVATLTTVGYGDVYPITAMGKIISALIAVIGVGFVALPTGIISSAFVEKIQSKKQKAITCKCPNCNTQITIT